MKAKLRLARESAQQYSQNVGEYSEAYEIGYLEGFNKARELAKSLAGRFQPHLAMLIGVIAEGDENFEEEESV